MIYGVILAGGKGERFWPKSKRKYPKQLLPIISDQPMILETVERISSFVPRERIIIVAGKEHGIPIKKIVPGATLLLEPFGRNTACAIAYAAVSINPEDIMVVLPADHYIPDSDLFLKTLEKAIKVAKEGRIVTFGVVPMRAETGYGYIEIGDEIVKDVYEVKSFKEKPNQMQAQRFIREGKFLWNSGMFVWSSQKILSDIEQCMPEFYRELLNFKKAGLNPRATLKLYQKASNISIDYGVMEKAKDVAVVKSSFIWDDIGSWLALERVYKSDSSGNIKIGLHKGLITKDCIMVSDKGVIVTLGVSNLIIVRHKDAVFVCDKRSIKDIKKLVHQLSQDKNFKKYL